LPREIDRRFSQIDAGVISAGGGKLRAVSSESATDFQNFQPTRAGEIGGVRNVPLLRVAVRLDQFKETTRARRRVGKLHPARIRLPKRAHSFL